MTAELAPRDSTPGVGEPQMSPSGLIRFALEHKIDPAALKELVALHNAVEDRNAAREFNAARMRFRANCPPIVKNKTANITKREGGYSHSYSFADLPEIVRIVDGPLAAEGLSYTWDTEDANGKLHCTCILSHVNGHSERSSWTTTTETNAAMSAQQKVAAAYTFARRQTLIGVLGLTTTDPDTDGADVQGMRQITPNQAETILSLLAELGIDEKKFLATFPGAGKVADLRALQYPTAMAMLNSRKAAKGGKP
jgi:hypothetical protein